MNLTVEEKELLIAAAATSGEFWVNAVGSGVGCVKAGEIDFPKESNNDPVLVTKYMGAFDNLGNSGYVELVSNNSYKLTDSGWAKAKELEEEER